MARYSKIERSILNDQKFNELSDDAKLIFLVLLIHPHLTSIGAMRASLPGLASELGWSAERFFKAFNEVFEKGMVKHDEKACLIWLPNYLKHNRPESPNVVKSWENSLEYLPECNLKSELIQHVKNSVEYLSETFKEALPEVFLKSTERLSEDIPQSVTETITLTETVAVTDNKTDVSQEKPKLINQSSVLHIFEHWKKTFSHPNAILDEKRKRLIREGLKMRYSISQLCDAITGCSLTPYNMGENDRGQRYDGLHVIFRDADQIDRFIRNYHNPPHAVNPTDKLMQINLRAAKNWLHQKNKLEETSIDLK